MESSNGMQPQNPYDFIMDPSQRRQPLKPGSGKNKLVVMIAMGLVMIVVLLLGFVFITSIGKANNDDLVSLRAQQTELLRIIELGKKDLTDATLKNKLTSMQLFISSDGKKLDEFLSQRKVEVSKEQIASKKNSDIDSDLEKAKQEGSLDQALLGAVSDFSNEYYDTLSESLSNATTAKEKELLNRLITNIEASAKN